MENLVCAKPKHITKDNNIYLKQVRIRFGDTKGEMRKNNTFNPVGETKGIPG